MNGFVKCRLPLLSDGNWCASRSWRSRFNKLYLDGYFASALSQDEFNMACNVMRVGSSNGLSTAIDNTACYLHVRGTDFVTLGYASDWDRKYYRCAIRIAQEQLPNARFFVITDDSNYALALLAEIGIKVTTIMNDVTSDFKLFRCARNRILSRSTFAFWAAALANNSSIGLNITPATWADGTTRNLKLEKEITID